MAVDPVQAYKQALRSLEAATDRVEAFVEEITHAATILRRWEQVTILNLGICFPPGAELESINADNWQRMAGDTRDSTDGSATSSVSLTQVATISFG